MKTLICTTNLAQFPLLFLLLVTRPHLLHGECHGPRCHPSAAHAALSYHDRI